MTELNFSGCSIIGAWPQFSIQKSWELGSNFLNSSATLGGVTESFSPQIIAVSAKKTLKTPEELKRQRINENPALRIGDPRELGNLCAYLCSVHAGFITGQNIVIDGGAYPGTL